MSDWLHRVLPRPWAGVALATWYLLLMLLILYASGLQPPPPFKYGGI